MIVNCEPGLLAEKCFQNKYGNIYIFAKLKISASRKYILLHTYFMKVIQYVDLYQPRFANSWLSKTSGNPRWAHNLPSSLDQHFHPKRGWKCWPRDYRNFSNFLWIFFLQIWDAHEDLKETEMFKFALERCRHIHLSNSHVHYDMHGMERNSFFNDRTYWPAVFTFSYFFKGQNKQTLINVLILDYASSHPYLGTITRKAF